MRRALERLARASWHGRGSWPARTLAALLRPASWAWASLAAARNGYYDRVGGTPVAGMRVVSVGNLAVGGTGKTPVTSWIARRLSDRGARPAIILRGYGRDEVLLHRAWTPDAEVIADPDRVAAARAARDRGADVAVLDDGFQHRRVARDLDLVLLAVEDARPPRALPAGPYREAWSGLGRADAVLLTRRRASADDARRLADVVESDFPGLVRGAVHLAPAGWTSLGGGPTDSPTGSVLVVAAIAKPEDFRADVEGLTGARAELLAFPDHHEYTAADVRRLARRARGRPVVVTEKDAVKLAVHVAALGAVHVLAQELRWDWGEDAVGALVDALANGVGVR